MLQFNTAVFTIATRFTSRFLWRLNASLSTNTSVMVSESKTAVKLDDQIKQMISNIMIVDKQHLVLDKLKLELYNNLNIKPIIGEKIEKAQTTQEILEIMKTSMTEGDVLHILKAISVWVHNNKESNSSTKINKSSVQSQTKVNSTKSKNFVFDVEDPFSRYHNLSTSTMIKIIYKLAQTGDRNVKLLNYFFNNIIKYHELLNTKACSNLMFSMSTLNYSDERLLKKICKDFIKSKNVYGNETNFGTIISLLKSMAFVRYKNNVFLNQLCDDIIKSKIKYSNKQIASLLYSLATLGYHSQTVNNIIKEYFPNSKIEELQCFERLNLVWCFAIFKTLQNIHAESVLNEKFVSKILMYDVGNYKHLSYELKLLNINGYAQYALNNYSGPFLNNKIVPYVVSIRKKGKEAYYEALKATLKNMLPSTSHFNMNVNTNMGFLLDAEICVDHKFNFISMNDNTKNGNFIQIALLLVDYYDMCLGDTDYQGLIKLHRYLLEHKNYEVLIVPYQYFGIEDKIEKRTKYLRYQISQICRKKTNIN